MGRARPCRWRVEGEEGAKHGVPSSVECIIKIPRGKAHTCSPAACFVSCPDDFKLRRYRRPISATATEVPAGPGLRSPGIRLFPARDTTGRDTSDVFRAPWSPSNDASCLSASGLWSSVLSTRTRIQGNVGSALASRIFEPSPLGPLIDRLECWAGRRMSSFLASFFLSSTFWYTGCLSILGARQHWNIVAKLIRCARQFFYLEIILEARRRCDGYIRDVNFFWSFPVISSGKKY